MSKHVVIRLTREQAQAVVSAARASIVTYDDAIVVLGTPGTVHACHRGCRAIESALYQSRQSTETG